MTNDLSRHDHLGLETQAQAKPEIIAKKGHSLLSQLRIRRAVAKAFSDPAWHAPGLARFAASIGGALPEEDPGGVILAACNDFYYSRFTATLLLSIEAQRACQAVHLHLYEPSEATLAHIAMLKGAFRFVRLTWTIDRCDLAASLHYRTIYYAAGRFLVSALILNAQQRPILCIDGDGIAIRPVWPAYEPYLASGDVGLIFRKAKRKPWRGVLASAVGMNCTAGGRTFSSGVARALVALLPRGHRFHLDQIVLYYSAVHAAKRAGNIGFFDMPHGFADHGFNEDAVIWTAKGWRIKDSERYQAIKRAIDEAAPALAATGSQTAS